jgi:hypothetical protein
MISIEKCRRLLGEIAKEWTNAEVLEVRDWLEQMADLILEVNKKQTIKR